MSLHSVSKDTTNYVLVLKLWIVFIVTILLLIVKKTRPILTLFLSAIEDIVEFDNSDTTNICDRINNLQKHRKSVINDKLYSELQNLRLLGNRYAQQDQEMVMPEQDKKTIKTAIYNIVKEILTLPTEYKKWQKEEKIKKKKNKQRSIFAVVTTIILGLLGLFLCKRK